MAHGAECPPDARCGKNPGVVIDDDAVPVGNAERADFRREFIRRRKHMRQRRRLVRDGVEIEKNRARNAAAPMLFDRRRISRHAP